MQRGAKIALGVLIAGGGLVALMVAGEKDANAATPPQVKPPLPPPQPGSVPVPPSGGVVLVPAIPPPGDDDDGPGAGSPPPIVAPPVTQPIPLPGGGSFNPGTGVGPGSIPLPGIVPDPNGNTITLPGLGTFNPATGNVFGPNGTIIGTFDPATSIFTPAPGVTPPPPPPLVKLPPLIPLPTQLPPVVGPNGNPTAPSVPAPPPPSAPTITLPPVIVTPGNPSQPTNVSADTLTTIAAMLSQEQSPRWRKMPEPTLVTWQKNRGLVADGSFGTITALRMADETGMIPIIRGWPKGSSPGGRWLPDYRAALIAKAQTAQEPRKSQLLAAAEREKGQGWGTPEKPITTLIHLQEA